MIGLDTNVLVRYFAQDDLAQAKRAERLLSLAESPEGPCFVSLATVMELSWVLRSRYAMTDLRIADAIEELLFTEGIHLQNQYEVFIAISVLRSGDGSFEDALIAALGTWAGCTATLTFDKRALHLPGFKPA